MKGYLILVAYDIVDIHAIKADKVIQLYEFEGNFYDLLMTAKELAEEVPRGLPDFYVLYTDSKNEADILALASSLEIALEDERFDEADALLEEAPYRIGHLIKICAYQSSELGKEYVGITSCIEYVDGSVVCRSGAFKFGCHRFEDRGVEIHLFDDKVELRFYSEYRYSHGLEMSMDKFKEMFGNAKSLEEFIKILDSVSKRA